jgi:hypothetical protein
VTFAPKTDVNLKKKPNETKKKTALRWVFLGGYFWVLLGGFYWAGFFGQVFYCQPWSEGSRTHTVGM